MFIRGFEELKYSGPGYPGTRLRPVARGSGPVAAEYTGDPWYPGHGQDRPSIRMPLPDEAGLAEPRGAQPGKLRVQHRELPNGSNTRLRMPDRNFLSVVADQEFGNNFHKSFWLIHLHPVSSILDDFDLRTGTDSGDGPGIFGQNIPGT